MGLSKSRLENHKRKKETEEAQKVQDVLLRGRPESGLSNVFPNEAVLLFSSSSLLSLVKVECE